MHEDALTPCRVRFGSLDLRLHPGHRRYVEILPNALRVWPSPDDVTAPALELVAIDGAERRPRAEQTDDVLRMTATEEGVRVFTAISELVLERGRSPARASLTVHVSGQDPRSVNRYIVMHLQKLLQLLGCLRLHGAAAVLDGRTHVFLGDKGAGKSTLSLALGRAGATVLADDQLVVRHGQHGTLLSGVDGGLRLTEKTERHFFAERLNGAPQDFAGTLKKEVALADYVPARPGVDEVPHTLFFSRVGESLTVEPMSRSIAARRILDAVLPLHRFAGPEDLSDFLGLVTSFVHAVEAFDLCLSPDLADLDQFVNRLRGGSR